MYVNWVTHLQWFPIRIMCHNYPFLLNKNKKKIQEDKSLGWQEQVRMIYIHK